MTYERFENLPVWQAGLELARGVYQLTALPPFRRNRGLRDQIERAAVSVSNNIAEGFEGGSGSKHPPAIKGAKGRPASPHGGGQKSESVPACQTASASAVGDKITCITFRLPPVHRAGGRATSPGAHSRAGSGCGPHSRRPAARRRPSA